jgi:tRNA1Val (adenine37-N6)-methyltransferase
MKIGTDGVLLGAWTPLNKAKRILDIGTGTGVIAIMLAQRSQEMVTIDAIEIDEDAFHQAIENINNCKWKDRLAVFHTSLQVFSKESSQQYDLIVSNPPFFLEGSKPTGSNRINARHVDSLTHEELILSSKALLTEEGILSIILPTDEGKQVITFAESQGLFCQQIVEVKPKFDKEVERLLLSFSKIRPSKVIKEKLTIQFEQRNDYTPEYITLTKEFYTIM